MAIKVTCGTCGKKYQVRDGGVGKKFKCKECGELLTVPDIEQQTDDADFYNLLTDAVELESQSKSIARVARKPMVKAEKYKGDEEGPTTRKKTNNYVEDLLATFMFIVDPANLFMFAFLLMLLFMRDVILPHAFILGYFGRFIILGWYSNYRFSIIYEAASGKQELPDMSPEEGFLLPMLQWFATWFLVHIPAFLYLAIALSFELSRLGEFGILGFDPNEITEILSAFHLGVFIFLYCLGLFFWPILALCVAIGGFETVYRIDLMVLTIFRTMPVYFFTAAAVFVTAVLQLVVSTMVAQIGFLGIIISLPFLLYMEIVSLRMIGHYYHHFKKRFAWSWG